MEILRRLKDAIQGKTLPGYRRSGRWPELRKKFLSGKVCAVCGGKSKLEAHHIMPFHLNAQLELDPNNLIPLCESKHNGMNCHLAVGHLGSFKSYNPDVQNDASICRGRLARRAA